MRTFAKPILAVISSALLLGCSGKVDNSASPSVSDEADAPTEMDPKESVAPGKRPLRRLKRSELRNTLGDLLGSTPEIPAEIPNDVLSDSGFIEAGIVSKVGAEVLSNWIEKLAITAVEKLDRISPCPSIPLARAEQDKCAKDFIEQFGRKAFRRPLTDPEKDELYGYYTDVLRASLGYEYRDSIRGLVALMLQSPRFLYHWERPAGAVSVEDGRIALGAHEMASRLSYLFWESMPDDELRQAADDNKIATQREVQTQARRLLADPRSRLPIENFYLQWLGIGDISGKVKDPTYAFSPELGQAMLRESRRFIIWVMDNDASVKTLLTSPAAFIDDPKLATLYGFTGAVSSEAKLVKLDDKQRAGLLTRAAFLTANSLDSELNPIKRGIEVTERLLCLGVPPPPANFAAPKSADPNLSTRQRLAEHGDNACARSCHGVFDPPGLAFENYDGIGRYRGIDHGKAVDASATIQFPSGDQQVQDAVDLSRRLAESPDVHQCLAQYWMQNILRRQQETGDESSIRLAASRLSNQPDDLRELIVNLVSSSAFRFRAPSQGEEIQ